MSDFNAHVTGLESFMRRFQKAPQIVTEELANAGKRAGLAVEAGAKRKVRVWRRDLYRSITSTQAPFGTTVTPLLTTTRVGTAKKYARAEEFGRPSGAPMPPPGALLAWMKAHGMDPGRRSQAAAARGGYFSNEFLLARKIKAKAPDPHPFLMNTFNELKPQIQKEFDQVAKRVIARLQGGG